MTDQIPIERLAISWCSNNKPHVCTEECKSDTAIVPEGLAKEKHTDLTDDQYNHLLTMMIVRKYGDGNKEEEVNHMKSIIKLL